MMLEAREIKRRLRANRQARPRRWPASLADLATRYGCHRSLMTKALADPRRYPDARRFIEQAVKAGAERALTAPVGALTRPVRRQMSAMNERQLDAIIADPPCGSGNFLTAATGLMEKAATSAGRSEMRTASIKGFDSEVGGVQITAGTGSGKTHTFVARLLQEMEKRQSISRKVPVRIEIAPDIEVVVMAHLSKALTSTVLRLLREQIQGLVLGIPTHQMRATVRPSLDRFDRTPARRGNRAPKTPRRSSSTR